MTHGAGRATTMAAGCTIPTMAGYGSPVMSGLPPGLHGGLAAATAAGRHWDQAWALAWRWISPSAGGYLWVPNICIVPIALAIGEDLRTTKHTTIRPPSSTTIM
jgi:hypothetical protein